VLPDWYTRVVHVTLAMARPWKHPNSGVYWLRRRVPDDLRALVGKREEKRSLGTRSPDEAKIRHAQLITELDAQWQNLRAGPRALTEREAGEIAAPIYDQHLAHYSENPSEQKFWDVKVGEELWTESPVKLPPLDDENALAKWIATPDPACSKKSEMKDWCLAAAQQGLSERGLATTPENKTKLAQAISKSMQSASLTLARYGSGDFSSYSLAPHQQIENSQPARLGMGPKKAVTFQALFDGWASEKSPGAKTRYSWQRVVAQLVAFLGHDDAARLTAEDLIRWKASLVEAGLKAKTIRDGKLAPIRAILQWGVDNRRLPKNAGERVTIDLRSKLADRKRGYSEDEARILLTAARNENSPLLRWVPWLSAYTGARVSEISQLRVEDVVQLEGFWCVRFAPEAGSLKNSNSERAVPLHPSLISQGFLEFVKQVGSGPLYFDTKPDRFGSRGGRATKVLSSWVRSLGLTDPRLSPSHSWRHRLRTLGRRHGLATDILDAITGHQRKTVADSYGEFPMRALYRELEKIPEI
jgi:integrase